MPSREAQQEHQRPAVALARVRHPQQEQRREQIPLVHLDAEHIQQHKQHAAAQGEVLSLPLRMNMGRTITNGSAMATSPTIVKLALKVAKPRKISAKVSPAAISAEFQSAFLRLKSITPSELRPPVPPDPRPAALCGKVPCCRPDGKSSCASSRSASRRSRPARSHR